MKYVFLKNEKSPQILVQAVKLIGTKEIVGAKHNETIIEWGRGLGLGRIYTNDEIPWCGLFIGHVCRMAGLEVISKPLWALSWSNWGDEVKEPMLGDILTFKRNGGGHVGLYVGEDSKCYHVLGGNQSNAVNVTRIDKTRLYKARRTAWKIAQPNNVRKIFLDAKGEISTNEA